MGHVTLVAIAGYTILVPRLGNSFEDQAPVDGSWADRSWNELLRLHSSYFTAWQGEFQLNLST